MSQCIAPRGAAQSSRQGFRCSEALGFLEKCSELKFSRMKSCAPVFFYTGNVVNSVTDATAKFHHCFHRSIRPSEDCEHPDWFFCRWQCRIWKEFSEMCNPLTRRCAV